MSLFAELKRRNVIRVAIGYLAVSWLVLQAGSLIFGALDLPNSMLRGLLALLLVGFIPTLVFSWVYELTPEGLKRESEVDRSQSVTHLTGRKLDFLVIGVLAAVVALLLLDRFVVGPRHAARVAAREGAPISAAPAAAETPAAPAAQAGAASIAVLPFLDMSQAKDQEYFSDGLSEELLNLLAKVPELRVIARTSSFSFKGKEVDVATIAKTLNVGNVLEGSVRKSGNTLRITAQLIRTADSSHLWSETYDRELTDIFKVQDEIAGAVVSALKLKLLPAEARKDNAHQTSNLEAYNQFLLGRQLFNRTNLDGWRRAEVAYRQALALDPNYAAAWAGLASAQSFLSDFGETTQQVAETKRQALESAEKAIALAPNLADGYEARGWLRGTTFWDWSGAEADYDRAFSLDPSSGRLRQRRAELLSYLGRLPEAIAAIREAIDLDPLSDANWVDLSAFLLETEGTGPAREALAKAAKLNPDSSFAWATIGMVEILDGKADSAQVAFNRAADVWTVFGSALVEHKLGHAQAAQAALDKLVKGYAQGAAFQIAEVHTWRGEPDQAFEWLDRAYAQHDGGLATLKYDAFLKPLRGDPRFAAMVKKMGLPP